MLESNCFVQTAFNCYSRLPDLPTIFNHYKMDNPMASSTFTVLCNHHLYLVSKLGLLDLLFLYSFLHEASYLLEFSFSPQSMHWAPTSGLLTFSSCELRRNQKGQKCLPQATEFEPSSQSHFFSPFKGSSGDDYLLFKDYIQVILHM